MLARCHLNSEIEVYSTHARFTQRRDAGKPKPALDIKFPVETRNGDRTESQARAGFGRLHRGMGRFRRGTKRRVQRLGGALDDYAAQKGLVRAFITLTCPGSSRDAVEGFSAWSGYILHALNNWLAKKQQRFSGLTDFVRLHTWELQKRGAEHLHYVCCLSEKVFSVVEKEFRSWFHNLLLRVSDLASVDIFERGNGGGTWRGKPEVLQIRVARVEKSVSAYLSKYLSKELSHQGRGFASLSIPRPARLWGASRSLREYQKRRSISVSSNSGMEADFLAITAIQELAKKKGVKFSVNTSHAGLTTRMRFFFSGDSSAYEEFFLDVKRIMEDVNQKEYVEIPRRKGIRMKFKKALRIHSKSKSRVAFNEAYGDGLSKLLANWVNQVPVDRRDLEVLAMAVESFDEVLLVDSREVFPVVANKKATVEQMALEFLKSSL